MLFLKMTNILSRVMKIKTSLTHHPVEIPALTVHTGRLADAVAVICSVAACPSFPVCHAGGIGDTVHRAAVTHGGAGRRYILCSSTRTCGG